MSLTPWEAAVIEGINGADDHQYIVSTESEMQAAMELWQRDLVTITPVVVPRFPQVDRNIWTRGQQTERTKGFLVRMTTLGRNTYGANNV